MIRALLVFLFFLSLYAISIFLSTQQPGFASLRYGDAEYTISLAHFVTGLFILILLLYLFFKLLGLLFNSPRFLCNKILTRLHNKTLNDTQQGLKKYIQGDWTQSEKLLLRGATDSRTSSGVCKRAAQAAHKRAHHKGYDAQTNYMWAAKAAHKRGDHKGRDAHLAAAKNACPEGEQTDTLMILQAEMLLEQNLHEQALTSLSEQAESIRSNPKIATMFANAYEQLQDWDKLAGIISQLKSCKKLDAVFCARMENQALKGLLKAEQNDAETVANKYKNQLLGDSELIVEYVSALRRQTQHKQAEDIVLGALNKDWNTELAYQFGLIEFKDPAAVLTKAEKWIEKNMDDANLYLSLGRICKKAQLWGKAKTYFESSLSREPRAETYAELASIHEQLDESEDACRYAKEGLNAAVHKT